MKGSKVFLTGVLGLALTLALLWLLGAVPLVRAAGFTVDVTNDENDGSCDAGDCSLREAIIAANGNGEADIITLGSGIFVLSLAGVDEDEGATGDLDITAPVTITGAGPNETIIDADGIDRVFDIDSGVATVVISGVRIINGNVAYSGGGIESYDTHLTLVNSVVISNTAGSYGGGVRSSRGDVILDGTQVLSNTAVRGGGVHISYSPGSLTLTGDGVIAYNRSIGNGMDGSGGGVYLGSSSATLGAGQILSNTAGGYGGGVFVSTGSVTLSGTQISSNTGQYGGGVHVRSGGSVTLEVGQISSNTAVWDGGGLYVNQGSATLQGGLILDNSAPDGGGVYLASGSATLQGGQILSNTASRIGGGVCVYGSAAVFTQTGDSLIAYNRTTGTALDEGGGGVYVQYGSATLNGGQVASNTASYGGGMYVRSTGATFTQTGTSTIAHNTAITSGGGLYVDSGSAALQGGQILDNDAVDGGGVYVYYGDVTLDGGAVVDNTAERGGGMYIHQTDTTLTHGQIVDNEALSDGGGVYVQMSIATLIQTGDVTITHNTATHGGGIYLSYGNAVLGGGRVVSNSADYGGGLYLAEGPAELSVSGGAIISNTATWSGGGLFVLDGGATLSRTILAFNEADDGGAIFHDGSGTLDLLNTTLSHNTARDGSGGGLRNDGGVATLTYVTVVSNTATDGGGGIHFGAGTVFLKDTILADNGAVNCNAGLTSKGYNLEDDDTCGLGVDDIIGADPLLGPLDDNGGDTLTHALLDGSQAIDGGTCVLGVDTDQRGVSRPYNDDCDIGAYEWARKKVYLPLVLR
jgi:fibronectin-binding autotransporter adhesin